MKNRMFKMMHILLGSVICITIMGTSADAKETWQTKLDDMCSEMSEEADDILEKEITTKDESEVPEEDKSTTLVSYDIKNAIPVCDLNSDYSMIADYDKSDGDFSKLIKWDNRWYVPATNMTGGYAAIYTKGETDGYQVYGTFFDEDEIYCGDTLNDIKGTVEKAFDGKDIAEIKIISVPFYKINLIYAREDDGKEYVVPYQHTGAGVLENIGETEGEVYTVDDFMTAMDSAYAEYTQKELKDIADKQLIGGFGPKLRDVPKKIETDKNVNKSLVMISGCVCVVIVCAAVIVIKRRRELNED